MNNLYFDLSDKLLRDLAGKITIIDQNFIKNLIKNWKIKDFMDDEDGTVRNKYAIEEFNKIGRRIIDIIPENINYAILCKNNYEIKAALNSHTFQGAMSIYLISMFIFNNYALKEKNLTNEQKVFSRLTMNILDNYQGLLFSYLSGDYLTVIQKTRIVYECYVIFLFINKYHDNNGEELATAFLDHLNIIQNRIIKDTSRENDISKDEIDGLKEKYGNDYDDNYGWTKSVIHEKTNRKLGFMAKEVGMDSGMSFIYRWTSNFIHTNAFSINAKTLIDPKLIGGYLPLTADMLIRQVIYYVENVCKKKEESKFITILLSGLEKEIFPDSMFNEKQNL